MIKVAVVGNPNVGKTALINYLTNSSLKIGNWPGVTVEKKEAYLNYKGENIYFIDLPGIYNFTPYSLEEKITRDYLLKENVDIILNVLDSKNIKKGLLLTSQILEFEIPTLVVFNMWDEVPPNFDINLKNFETLLNVKAVKASAKKGFGKEEILNLILKLKRENYLKPKFIIFRKEIENILKTLPFKRFINVKLLEGDKDILKEYGPRLKEKDLEKLNSQRKLLEKKYKKEISDIIFTERYKWVNTIVFQSTKGNLDNISDLTDKIDDIILNPKLSPFFLIGFIYLFFKVIFLVTDPFIEYIGHIQDLFSSLLSNINFGKFEILKSFIENVFIQGIGILFSFVPLIFVIYLLFGILEDSGIMARIALLSDRFMHKIGLHGNAIIPIVLGYGCNVPAVLSTRVMSTFKEKLILALSLPFTLCTARLPIIAFFGTTFFEKYKSLLTAFIYILSLFLTLFSLFFLKKIFKVESSQEVLIELPSYRFPKISYVFKYALDKVLDYLKGVTSIIFISLLVLYFILNFPPHADVENSLGAYISKLLLPLFSILDINSWQVILSLFPGFIAKESVVASLKEILSLSQTSLNQILSKKGALAFVIFSSFYVSCVATLSAIKKELGYKYAIFSVIFSISLAFLTAFIFSNVIFQVLSCLNMF